LAIPAGIRNARRIDAGWELQVVAHGRPAYSNERTMKRERLRRRIYWISGLFLLFALAFLISVIFLNPSSVGNENFVWFFNLWALIWALIFIIVLALTYLLARNLIKLLFEYPAQERGRIKGKLILTFTIFSLFPALIMFFLAFGLINQNLTRWVSAPSEQLLESSHAISEQYYRQQQELILLRARGLADEFDGTVPREWERAVRDAGFTGFQLIEPDRVTAAGQAADDIAPGPESLERVLSGEQVYGLERRLHRGEGFLDAGYVGLPMLREGRPSALILYFEIPRSVAFHTAAVAEANQTYRGLTGTLASLRINYFSILALTTVAVVFGFVWLGGYIARRLTIPLEALAEGARELSQGNLDHRVQVEAMDELGVLVEAFNRMAGQLRQNRLQLEKANEELRQTNVQLDERRRYIETVLQNIATGVLTIDQDGVVRTANEAALRMLQATREAVLNRPIERVVSPEVHREFQELEKRARLYGTYRRQVILQRGEQRIYVAATATLNSIDLEGEREEFLIVLDDLTELIRAEKFAAWQEVARRLAHEIKNPLTPIQLSAQRIEKRFSRLFPNSSQSENPQWQDFAKMLEESTRIIRVESELLKNLVGEFSRFARLPISRPCPVDLRELVENTLARYDGALGQVEVRTHFDPALQEVRVDPEQMQRVLVNLIDNSLDALADVESPRRIRISGRLHASRKTAALTIEDNGTGIDAEEFEQLFLPYFSTKRKGTGLGLAIVRQIVSEQNGSVRAESNPPRGARFIIELPVDLEK
jgi:two-component system, NtrC family, nitrogen regulation sensor histidine kinase NtrY